MTSRLPKKKPTKKLVQLTLFLDENQKQIQYWTTRVGDFFEEASARLSGGTRYQIDSTCEYCPDVGLSRSRFIESKASGRGARVILYEGRLEREKHWAAKNGASIEYYCWRHRTYTRECDSEDQLNASLAKTTSQVIILDLETLCGFLAETPARIINRGNTSMWSRGWTLSYKTLLDAAHKEAERSRLRVMGHTIHNLSIYRITPDDPF